LRDGALREGVDDPAVLHLDERGGAEGDRRCRICAVEDLQHAVAEKPSGVEVAAPSGSAGSARRRKTSTEAVGVARDEVAGAAREGDPSAAFWKPDVGGIPGIAGALVARRVDVDARRAPCDPVVHEDVGGAVGVVGDEVRRVRK
jgi:hypothetical protein